MGHWCTDENIGLRRGINNIVVAMSQDLVQQFRAITDLPDVSTEDIESLFTVNNWDLNSTLSSYFESGFNLIKAVDDDVRVDSSNSTVRSGMGSRSSGYETLNAYDMYDLHDLIPKLPPAPVISNNWQFQLGIHQSTPPPTKNLFKWLIWLILLVPKNFITYLLNWMFRSTNSFPLKFNYDNYTEGNTKISLAFPEYRIWQSNYNDLHQKCKGDYNWLIVVLVDNATETFVTDLLGNSRFKSLASDENLFVGNVDTNPEAWQVGNTYGCRKLPFIMLINNVSNNPSKLASMSVVYKSNMASHIHDTKAVIPKLVKNLLKQIEHYTPQLIAAKSDKQEMEFARALKQTQDDAYLRSLESDKVKKQEKQRQRSLVIYEEQRLKYLKHLQQSNWFENINKNGSIRLQIKLPHQKIIVTLRPELSLKDLYIYIATLMEDLQDVTAEPIEFEYGEFNFEVSQPYPKRVYDQLHTTVGENFKLGMTILVEPN